MSHKRLRYLCIIATVLLFAGSAFGQTLLAHYKLEDSGTTVDDSSANGYDGTKVGSPVRVTGKVDSYALQFSGLGQYVDVPQDLYRDTMKIEAYVLPLSPWPWGLQSVVEIGGTTFAERAGLFILTYGSDAETSILGMHHGHFRVWKNIPKLHSNAWVHLSAVFTATSIDVYVDGVLANNGSRLFDHFAVDSDKTSHTYIGRNTTSTQMGNAFDLKSKVDEVKIWDLGEVDYGEDVAWQLSGDPGVATNNSTGAPANLIPVGSPTFAAVPPPLDFRLTGALSLNGTNQQAYYTPPMGEVRNFYGTNLTLTAWVKPSRTFTGCASVIEISGNSTTKLAGLLLGGNGSAWYIHNDRAIQKTGVWSVGEWLHLTAVLTPATLTLYKNGLQIDQQWASPTVGMDALNATELNTVRIGCDVSSSNFWLPGLIQKVEVFEDALTPEEVFSICNGN